MDTSIREILKRTISITETHAESDQSGTISEKWGDVSINYKGYSKYDVIKIEDSSVIVDKASLRHTHLYLADNIQDKIRALNEYYIKNNIGPYKYAFGNNTDDSDEWGSIIEMDADIINAIYSEKDGQEYYRLNISKENQTYPVISILTLTNSKYIINPEEIAKNGNKLIVAKGEESELKNINLDIAYSKTQEGVNYYTVSGSVKDKNGDIYSVDALVPLYAYDEDGNSINITEIRPCEPTEEEIDLVNDLLDVLTIGEMPVGETRFDVSIKGTTSTITINEGYNLTNIVIPEDYNKTVKIIGPIKDGASITYNTPGKKTLYVTNTDEEPIDLVLTANGTTYLSGNYDDIVYEGSSLTGSTNNYASIYGNVIIADDTKKSVNIQANFVGDPNNSIISNTSQPITINAKNQNANIDINCPNSTVTLGVGTYGEVIANVADDTLKLTINTHINKLHLKNGNIFINNGKNIINDLVNEIICDYEYSVDYNKATILPSNLSNGCEYTLSEDKNGAVACTVLASGDTVINLNGHNINGNTTRTAALYARSSAHIDIHGEGNITNELAYCVWGADNTIINIYGGKFTGETHTIYSYKGNINIYGGEFILLAGDTDENGHWKFLLNCYDANYTAGTAIIKVYGGKYYNFDPANAYGEPGAPISYVAEGYESVCIDEANQIYEVRKL